MHRRLRKLCAVLALGAGALWTAVSARAVNTQKMIGQTATLLPNGNVLIAGGDDGSGPVALTFLDEVQNGVIVAGPGMNIAQSSATATVLADGRVLVAGGITTGGNPTNAVEIYDPVANSWQTVASMNDARVHHTATLLQNGTVLVCGGQNSLSLASSFDGTCEVYTPQASPGVGSWSGLIDMLTNGNGGRAMHTATLIKDGRVFIAGGFGAGSGVMTPLDTTEMYNPTGNAITGAKALNVARGYHRATMMADGRVLLTGGANGDSLLADMGYLDTAEIYDPISDSIQSAAPMEERKSFHSSYLYPDGQVYLAGGLGNITTNYFRLGPIAATFSDGSFINETAAGVVGGSETATINADDSEVYLNLDLNFTPQASGIIEDGEIDLAGPSVTDAQATFPLGSSEFPPGIEGGSGPYPNGTGLKIDLAGTYLTCAAGGNGPCGLLINSAAPAQNVAGTSFFPELAAQSLGTSGPDYGCVEFPNPIGTTNSPETIPAVSNNTCTAALNDAGAYAAAAKGSIVCGDYTITLNPVFSGATINDLQLSLTNGNWTYTDSSCGTSCTGFTYTASLTGGTAKTSDGSITSVSAVDSSGDIDVRACFTGLTGTISASTSTSNTEPSPAKSAGATLSATANVLFNPSYVNLSGQTFSIDVATVQIRRMAFSDFECYNEKTNSWSLSCTYRPAGPERFGQTATLLPNGDARIWGGQTCSPTSCYNGAGSPAGCPNVGGVSNQVWEPGCSAFTPQDLLGTQLTVVPVGQGNWNSVGGSMSTPRGNFTTTTLPNGNLLMTGGTNGQTTLSAVDIFNPATQTFSPAAPMLLGRDLHTTTLLTNGTVLVTGGFSAQGASTGTVNDCEIYYPNTNTWVETTPLNQARDNFTATVMPDGNVVVVGGYQNGSYLNSVEVYYSTSATWSYLAPIPEARALHTAALLSNGKLLVAGGVNGTGVLSTAWIYDPIANSWSAAAGMPYKVHSAGSALLSNGDVLITGGDNGFGELDTALRYVFASNSWLTTEFYLSAGGAKQGRLNHTTTLLPNGEVMVAGGATADGNTITDVQLFHPSANVWTELQTFNSPRAYHTTTVAPNGEMYAFGGYNGSSYLSSGESLPFAAGAVPDSLSPVSPSIRQSSITAVDSPVFPRGQELTLRGFNFKGYTEASGGAGGSGNSDQDKPRILLQALDHSSGGATQGTGGFIIDLSTYLPANTPDAVTAGENQWSNVDSSITVILPNTSEAALPYGWYSLREVNNAVYSQALLVQAGPALPSAPVTNIVPNPNPPNSATQVDWTWTAPVGGNLNGYHVYSATTSFLLTQIDNPSGGPIPTSWLQTNLQPNTTATIAVAPYSVTGDGPLAFSATYYTLAAVPSAVQVASVTFNSILLEWNTSGNAAGTVYEVLMSTVDALATGLSISTPVPEAAGLTTDYAFITPLQPLTTYWLSVRAYNGEGLPTAWAVPVVSSETRQSVSGVQGFPLTTTSIDWSWDDAKLNTAAGEHYNVFNATTGVLIVSTASPSFIEVGLSTNTQAAIQVAAVTADGSGFAQGPLSASASVYTDAAVPSFVSPPVLDLSTGGFTVQWGANQNPIGTTYQCVVTAPPGETGSTATVTTLFTGVGNLSPPAELFEIAVRAINFAGVATDAANPNNLLVIGSTSTLANPPGPLSLVATTPSSISVSWTSDGNASSATFEVTYSTDDFLTSVNYALPFSANSNQTSITIGPLLTSTTYSIRVRAQNINHQYTAYTNVLTTGTFNGGAPAGSLGFFIPANSGATVTGSLGNGRQITMTVPAGAFTSDTFVAISSFDAVGDNVCNSPADIGISLVTVPSNQEPLKPVSLTLSYQASELGSIPATQAALERFDPTSNSCIPLETSVNTAEETLTATLNHFSQYQVNQVAPAATSDFTQIFPNPFYPSRGNGYVTFSNMPAAAHLTIYTIRGEKVWDTTSNGSGLAIWTGINHRGRSVASGVYFAVVDDGSHAHVYKLAVVR